MLLCFLLKFKGKIRKDQTIPSNLIAYQEKSSRRMQKYQAQSTKYRQTSNIYIYTHNDQMGFNSGMQSWFNI